MKFHGGGSVRVAYHSPSWAAEWVRHIFSLQAYVQPVFLKEKGLSCPFLTPAQTQYISALHTLTCYLPIHVLTYQINELSQVPPPVMLLPDDFKASSKIKVNNHLFHR